MVCNFHPWQRHVPQWSVSFVQLLFDECWKQVAPSCHQTLKNGLPEIQQGSPLFLKLLICEIIVTNDTIKADILALIKLYENKNKNPGEEIKEVVSYFYPIVDTLNALCNGNLTDKVVDDITHIFTTSSCDNFNGLFKNLQLSVTAT